MSGGGGCRSASAKAGSEKASSADLEATHSASAPPAPSHVAQPGPASPHAAHHLLLCSRPRSRVRPAMSSSCFLISRKSEKSAFVDRTGTAAGATGATATTDVLAAIFQLGSFQPITGEDTLGPPCSKKPAFHWSALAPARTNHKFLWERLEETGSQGPDWPREPEAGKLEQVNQRGEAERGVQEGERPSLSG